MERLKEYDEGYTLIEALVILVLVSIMATLTMTAFASYKKGQDHRGAVRELVGLLRNIQVRAVTEATTYQCVFTATTVTVYRDGNYPPSGANQVRTYSLPTANLAFEDVSFKHDDSSYPEKNCLFFARASADPGSLEVLRKDNGRKFEIDVEGLTGRVSYAG